jgi:hypothetical protein
VAPLVAVEALTVTEPLKVPGLGLNVGAATLAASADDKSSDENRRA